MRTIALALCAVGATAWTANDYARHQYNAHDYHPIPSVNLHEQELPFGYQPALTEETEVETISDSAIWNKLQELNGLEYYTHSHHGSNPHDTHPTDDHEYPEEHHHYRHIKYNDRQPVVVNSQRKVYHVTPRRYTRSYAAAEALPEAYAEDILFPTRKDDTLHTAKFLKAHRRVVEDEFGEREADIVLDGFTETT